MLATINMDLLKACRQPGWPARFLEQHAVDVCMQTVSWEKENGLAVRNEIRDSLGLCREHTRRMLALRLDNSTSATTAYLNVLFSVIQQLNRVPLPLKPAPNASTHRI